MIYLVLFPPSLRAKSEFLYIESGQIAETIKSLTCFGLTEPRTPGLYGARAVHAQSYFALFHDVSPRQLRARAYSVRAPTVNIAVRFLL